MKIGLFCFVLTLMLFGCDELSQQHKVQPGAEQSLSAPSEAATLGEEDRFVFPSQYAPFAEASVALDTRTGHLCKTYAWPDSSSVPSGLPVCSLNSPFRRKALFIPFDSSVLGSTKVYMGYTYIFDGKLWHRRSKLSRYKESTSKMDSNSDDQYDPLGLLTKEQKARSPLTEADIAIVAKTFGVTYAEASEEAKSHGYPVPKTIP